MTCCWKDCKASTKFRVNIIFTWKESLKGYRKNSGLYCCQRHKKTITPEVIIPAESFEQMAKEITEKGGKPFDREHTMLEFQRI